MTHAITHEVALFFPVDLGLELDFSRLQINDIVYEVFMSKPAGLSYRNRPLPEVSAKFFLYRFGIGLIQVSFSINETPGGCAAIACEAESINVGGEPIFLWCHERAQELIAHAQRFAVHRYDQRIVETEIFPVFVFDPGQVQNAERFIHDHYKVLYGIVAGEAHFEKLSGFVLQKDPIINLGYYENELIILKRFGAVISSQQAKTVLNFIALVYAQYWSLRSYHFILDSEMDNAQKTLERLPPYYKFWKIPSRYQKFSKEAIDFGKDKLSILDSLYSFSSTQAGLEPDWHLRTIFRSLNQVFNIDDLYKTLEIKLDRIEKSYNEARELLSTNFFIILDFVFFLWLIWGVFDTILLLTIARK